MRIFWYSINRLSAKPKVFSKKWLKRLLGIEYENYGDLMSKYLVQKITRKKIKFHNPPGDPMLKHYFIIGSILNFCNIKSIVWGSGIINKVHNVSPADFRAVRGPRTHKRLGDLNIKCPKVYGAPALLLPLFYNPFIEKKYKVGIIPHYTDFQIAKKIFKEEDGFKVINLMTRNVEEVTKEIIECEKTLSSSLHGIIVSHAYNIPSVWVEFSKNLFGDGIKFLDYLESVGIEPYVPVFIKGEQKENLEAIFLQISTLPVKGKVKSLQSGLMKACPFI